MSYRVIISNNAFDTLQALPYPVAEHIIDRISRHLADDYMRHSEPARAPYPKGRLYRSVFEHEDRIYQIAVVFIISQGSGGEEQLQVVYISYVAEDGSERP